MKPSPLLLAVAAFSVALGATRAAEPGPLVWSIDNVHSIGGHAPQVLGAPRAVIEDGRNALRFNGTSDGLIVPANPLEGQRTFTVEVLFKPDGDGPAEQRFVHMEDGRANRGLIETRVTRDRKWYLDTYLHVGASNKGVTLVDKEKLHACDRWYWAALVYDGRTMSHFVNGTKETEGLIDFGPMAAGRTSLGVRLNQVYWFKGCIAGLRITPRALAAAELQRIATDRTARPFEWQTATPESRGLSAAKLDAFRGQLAARGTKAFLLIRDDAIVHEWYAAGHGPEKPHFTASMAKAIVGGMSVAVALTDRRLSLDEPAARFVPPWRGDPRKSRITVRQLGSHTSGIEDAEADDLPHDKLTGWKGDFWKRLPVPRDPFTLARDVAPLIAEPGAEMHYSNPGIAMMDYVTTAALRDAPQRDLRSLLRERVMRPIGVPDAEWSVGYGKTVDLDGLPLVASWGGGGFTARATARVARLMLRDGDWDGRQVLSRDAVHAVTRDAGTPGNGAIGWWSNNDGTVSAMPRDAFWGAGAQHQIVLVIPSMKVIAVRNGGTLSSGDYAGARNRYFFEPLMEALHGD